MDEQLNENAIRINPDLTEKEIYKPSRIELLKDYQINIKFLSIGCIISVGCRDIAFSTVQEAIDALNLYFQDPYKERQKWEKLFNEQN